MWLRQGPRTGAMIRVAGEETGEGDESKRKSLAMWSEMKSVDGGFDLAEAVEGRAALRLFERQAERLEEMHGPQNGLRNIAQPFSISQPLLLPLLHLSSPVEQTSSFELHLLDLLMAAEML